MYGIKVLLALGLFLTTSYARPGGYAVKGGKNHKSTAIASASAQATAQASGGCPGTAQSSAIASATANAYASGSTSNAAAIANAFVDGGNIEKAISCNDANENANPVGDSDDLRSSNDHAGEPRKQSLDPEDGIPPAWGRHNVNTGSHGNTGSDGSVGTGQNQDRRQDCEVPAGVKGRRRPSGCTDKTTKENKPSDSNPLSKQHQGSEGAAVSKNPPTEGGYGDNNAEPGSYVEKKCSPRDATCMQNKPASSNPHPYDESPDLSASSSNPVTGDDDYGNNDAGARSCALGMPGCPKNKPSVSKPHATYNENPESSTSSKYPINTDGDYGSNPTHPGSEPCASGISGCSSNKPSVSYPYPTNNGNPESAGSNHHTGTDGGYKANPTHPGSVPCAGASGCSSDKPSVSNPYPSYHENPDLSAGSKHPMRMDDGHNPANSGSGPCASGAAGCSLNKPNISNSHPAYNGNPEYPDGSKHSVNTDDGYRSYPTNSGSGSCISGTPGCVSKKPSTSNPNPSYNENPGSKHPSSEDGDYEVNIPNPESQRCTPGAFGCSENKPSILNSHEPYPGSSDLPLNSQHRVEIDNSNDESNAGESEETPCYPGDPRCVRKKPKTTTPDSATTGIITSVPIECSSGSISCPNAKPGAPNAHPTFQGNPDLSAGPKHPTDFNGGHGSKSPTAGVNPDAETPGYPGSPRRPGTSNPFLNGEIDVSSIRHSGKPGKSPEFKTNPSNPFLHPHGQVRPPTGIKHPENPNGGSLDDSETPKLKPNPSNPFLTPHGNVDSKGDTNHPKVNSGFPQNTNPVNGTGYPVTNGDCRGSSSCTPDKSSKNPATTSRYPHESLDFSPNKPNPSNPFLPHNSEDGKSTGRKHPDLKPPTLKNPGSFGEGSYDRIDPHSIDKKGPDHQHEPNTWPGKEENGSNPFLVDGPLIKPKPDSHETSNPATSLPGYTSKLPSTELKPESDHNCQDGISSVNCDGKRAGDNTVQNSYTDGYRNKYPSSTENYGVKTHRPGVKGGSRRRGPPAQLQGSSGLGQNDFGFGNRGSAYNSAHADASANAYGSAHASSSSSNGGGHSSAKSEAYSNFGGSGSSNAWASSSASSSASAFASSSSHEGSGHWEQPPIPEVPAE